MIQPTKKKLKISNCPSPSKLSFTCLLLFSVSARGHVLRCQVEFGFFEQLQPGLDPKVWIDSTESFICLIFSVKS